MVVMVSGPEHPAQRTTDSVSITEARCPVASVTCMVTVYVPAVDGVPEIIPELVARLSPGGSEPDAMDQV